MIKDKDLRKLLRAYKIEAGRAIIKLANVWWTLFLVIMTALLLLASFFLKDCYAWASNVLISAGCGCFTGLAFYFLSNIRTNKIAKIQKEHRVIQSTIEVAKSIIGYGQYLDFSAKYGSRRPDVIADGYEVLLLIDELEAERGQIPLEIYDTVLSLGYDPADYDNLRSYRKSINAAADETAMKTCLSNIAHELTPFVDELVELLREREDQLMFMGKYFF